MPTLTRSQRKQSALLERVAPRGKLANSADPLVIAEKLWSALDTPLSLGLSLLAKNGQLKDLLDVSFDPARYLDSEVEAVRDDYQAIAFLKKTPLEIDGVDREKAAFKKFLEAEEQCRMTNARFRSFLVDPTIASKGVRAVLLAAQCKIHKWLGPRVDARSWALRCRFGPGSDVLNKGSSAQAYTKLSRLSVTADFYEGAQSLVLSNPGWYRNLPFSVDPQGLARLAMVTLPGNKVTFVPKTALIDRSIAVEPGMNIYAQLGIGALFRAMLKRHGLDLDNADPNRGFAYIGSLTGKIATIDLSMASDTLARELVRFLLPPAWYVALDWVRSKYGEYTDSDGFLHRLRYEKFSSMGNGFTFELESMIFYALAQASSEYCEVPTSEVRAFGDDITVQTEVVPLLTEVLSFAGFMINSQKSYSSGVFRESCGMDFFNGVNVRPYFLKEATLNNVTSLYRLANGVRRVAYRRNLGFGCDRKLRPVWTHIIQRIPSAFRAVLAPSQPVKYKCDLLAPVAGGEVAEVDGGIMSNLDEASVSPFVTPAREYQRGWLFALYKGRSRSIRAADFGQLKAYSLYRTRDGCDSDTTTMDRISIRGEGKARLTPALFVPEWGDLGPWR